MVLSLITFVQDAASAGLDDDTMQWPRVAVLVLAACRTVPHVPDDSDAILGRQAQELLDAVTAGDAKVWDRYLDPQIIYVSEAGELETKASLLPQITPLPAGITGKIAIGKLQIHRFGDTAVVMHVDEESESYFGHPLHDQYMTTQTWHYGEGGWKLVGTQVLATLIDPPAIELPADQLDDYVGTYRLTDSITYAITRDGATLVGQRSDRKAQPLRVEVKDVLFVPGQPRTRKIFLRDAHGQIDRMADRRESRDVVWIRQR
jgi:hypothetical protein